uniref:Receptor ligand binding region domain-containing protein n=2 Tax=Parascaris univalens TaxID=6257 RepID=A0A915CJZ3_PARUN
MLKYRHRLIRLFLVGLAFHSVTSSRAKGDEGQTVASKSRHRMDRPMLAALFLPPYHLKSTEASLEHRHLANIESVEPILDIAIGDAQSRYIYEWSLDEPWMKLLKVPINECEDQKRVAWAALEAVKWTNGSGLDVAFGPACDYVLATANRILSFSKVPMFTSAGFSEWFKDKANNAELMTRVGPLQDHIALMIEQLSDRFGWVRPTLFYQKAFWESELLESGFCKMMMTGLFVRSANKQSNLSPNPRILPNYEGDGGIREIYAQNLIDNVGVERAEYHQMKTVNDRVISVICGTALSVHLCLLFRVSTYLSGGYSAVGNRLFLAMIMSVWIHSCLSLLF